MVFRVAIPLTDFDRPLANQISRGWLTYIRERYLFDHPMFEWFDELDSHWDFIIVFDDGASDAWNGLNHSGLNVCFRFSTKADAIRFKLSWR